MSDLSPRPTWQMNTKYPKSASESSMRRPGYPQTRYSDSPLNYTNRTPPHQPRYGSPHQQQRYPSPYSQPSRPSPYSQPSRPSPSTVARNRPQSFDIRKANDGTHPRMNGPMRATAPLTYHGVPIRLNQPDHHRPSVHQPEPHYGSINMRRGQIHRQQQSASMRQINMYPGTSGRRQRPASDGSVPRSDADMRGANSESDIHNQSAMRGRPVQHSHSDQFTVRRENVPSGTYIASSSTTSLPQYAQLMTQTPQPQRFGSSGSIQATSGQPSQPETEGRNSYTAGVSPQLRYKKPNRLMIPHNSDGASLSSLYEDIAGQPDRAGFKGSRTPTSPVGRQPSYLTAMNMPVRQQQGKYFCNT